MLILIFILVFLHWKNPQSARAGEWKDYFREGRVASANLLFVAIFGGERNQFSEICFPHMGILAISKFSNSAPQIEPCEARLTTATGEEHIAKKIIA